MQIIILIFAINVNVVSAYNNKIDSLRNCIYNEKNDTTRILLLDEMVTEIFSINLDSALLYAKEALIRSEKIDFTRGKVISANNVAMTFLNKSQFDSVQKYLNLALYYNLKKNNIQELINTYRFKADLFRETTQFDSMQYYYDLALNIAIEHNKDDLRAAIYNNQALYYERITNYDNALLYYMNAMEIFKKNGSKKNEAIALGNIAGIYLKQKMWEIALEFFEKALEMNLEIQNNIEIASNYNNLGIIYKGLDNYQKSIQFFQKSIDVNEQIGDYGSIVITYYNLGNTARKRKQYNDAVYFFNESLEQSKKYEIVQGYAYNYYGLALTFNEFNQYNRAIEYYNLAINYAKELRLTEIELESYKDLYLLNESKGDFKDAYNNQSNYFALKDSISNLQNEQLISEIQAKYESEQKEKENALLKTQNDLQQYKINRQRILIILIIIIFSGTIITLTIYFRRNRKFEELYDELSFKNQKISYQSEKLEQMIRDFKKTEKFKTDLIDMVAHDLKNPLSSLLSIAEKIENEWVKNLVNTSSHQMLNMITNMLDIQKYGDDELQIKLGNHNLSAIVEEARFIVAYIIDQKRIFFEKDISDDIWVKTEKEILVRVLINLFSNSLKYTPINGYVGIKAAEFDDRIEIKVYDTGQGIPEDQIDSVFDKYIQVDSKQSGFARSSGLGLAFCKLAIEAHRSNIHVISREDVGTSFNFTLEKGEIENTKTGSTKKITSTTQFADFSEYRNIIDKLLDYKVYEVTSIKKVLKELEIYNDPVLNEWIQKIEQAIFTGNQTLYRELVSQS